MCNTRKTFLLGLICMITLFNVCAKGNYEIVEANKYFAPSAQKTIAILLYNDIDKPFGHNILPDFNESLLYALIGDINQAEKIMGKRLKPMKQIENHDWLEKIMNEYKLALKESRDEKYGCGCTNFMRIIFVTENKGYMRDIGYDEHLVYDSFMESGVLRSYFDQLHLFGDKYNYSPEKYVIPPQNQVIAILMYPNLYKEPNMPLVLFGDKKKTEEIMSEARAIKGQTAHREELSPKITYEGREWIEKIMAEYKSALDKAEKRKFYYNITATTAKIVFVTRDGCHTRNIGIVDKIVYEEFMRSEKLKKFFDGLGLTKELLEGKLQIEKPKDANNVERAK